MQQIYHFILRYYDPILSLLEKQQISNALKEPLEDISVPVKIEKDSSDKKKEQLKEAEESKVRRLQDLATLVLHTYVCQGRKTVKL